MGWDGGGGGRTEASLLSPVTGLMKESSTAAPRMDPSSLSSGVVVADRKTLFIALHRFFRL